MAKQIRANSGVKRSKKSFLRFPVVVKKLQKGTLLLGEKLAQLKDTYYDTFHDVPDDVKEGHLAVLAADDDLELKRFIVPLGFLRHPSFLRLLEKAAEEYGFDHKGALMVPCQPSELERILNELTNIHPH